MLKAAINAKLTGNYEKIVVATINKLAEDKTPIATIPDSHYSVYLQATILNGFNFLAFTFVSPIDIKTMSGCKLTFTTAESEFVLDSESDVLESDYSTNNQIGITLVDTDMEDDFIAFVNANEVTEMRIEAKIGKVFKKKIAFTYREVNMEAFKASMEPKEAEATGEVSVPGGSSSLGI